jgi:hypothetical protein
VPTVRSRLAIVRARFSASEMVALLPFAIKYTTCAFRALSSGRTAPAGQNPARGGQALGVVHSPGPRDFHLDGGRPLAYAQVP